MAAAVLTINSKNYGTWSMRGWLLCKLSGIDFVTEVVPSDDPSTRAELLLLSPSFLVPRLQVGDVTMWGTLSIAQYLAEAFQDAGLLPIEPVERARCRSICDEMHSGFSNLRAAMPMNIKAHHPGFKPWAGAQQDIDRIAEIWEMCLGASGGPFLFGRPTQADAMFAPVCSRFVTYDVKLPSDCSSYRDRVLAMPEVQEWVAGAQAEPDDLDELDAEF
jgi:glutathione S-transferase